MSDHANLLLEWCAECVVLCSELTQTLHAERAALIAFRMSDLGEATVRKEQLGRQLAIRRQRMRETMLRQFGTTDAETLASRLPADRAEGWRLRHVEWSTAWAELVAIAEQNQRLLKHSLKNALIPTVTVMGLQVGFLIGGAIVVETLFAMPGLGTFGIDAIIARDYQQVQGFALITALAFVFINLLVDLTYTFLDPRIRYA